MKKSRNRRKGPPRGVQRHVIPSRESDQLESSFFDYFLSSAARNECIKFVEKCDRYLVETACKMHLVCFVNEGDKKCAVTSLKDRLIHYGFILSWVFLISIRVVALLKQIKTDETIGVRTFICATSLAVCATSFCIAFAGIAVVQKTVDVFNFIESIQLSIGFAVGHKVSYYNSLSVGLKILAICAAMWVVSIDATLLSLVFSDLPVFTYPILQRFGLIPSLPVPPLVWSFLLLPIEFSTNMLPCVAAAVTGNLMMKVVGAYMVCINAVRNLPLRNDDDLRTMQHLYICIEWFNRVLAVWVKVFLPMAVSSMSIGMIIVSYVTVRGDQLPLLVYICFPLVWAFLMGIIFWVAYDVVMAKRASGDVVGQIQSYAFRYGQVSDDPEKLEMQKRAKALRLASCPIGEFGEMSLDLPVDVWEGTLDQLLVLLAL